MPVFPGQSPSQVIVSSVLLQLFYTTGQSLHGSGPELAGLEMVCSRT